MQLGTVLQTNQGISCYPKTLTRKVWVREMSIDNCLGDFEPRTSEEEQTEDRLFEEDILNKYDGIKKKVVEMLIGGFNFLEISKELNLRECEIYKIKKELANDLNYLHNTNTHDHISVVIKLHILSKLKQLSKRIYSVWYVDNGLKEYDRPTIKTIEDYIEDVLLELGGGSVIYRTPQRRRQLYEICPDQLSLF